MAENYVIDISGEWSLEDLYVFPRAFEQVYFLIYSLSENIGEEEIERIRHAYEAFPWRGGYSAVGFYDQLKFTTPRRDRPQIRGIEYHSPGWIELELLVEVAVMVGALVTSVTGSIRLINSTYSRIMKDMQRRKLMRIEIKSAELKLTRDQLAFVEECSSTMARVLGFSNIQEIHDRTGHPYRSLKILLSLFRRVRTLVEYETKGKAHLPSSSTERRGTTIGDAE
jgi:hypothetical protein